MTDTSRSSTRRRVEVLPVEDAHASEVAEFYRAVWDPAATPERVRTARAAAGAANLAEPGKPLPTFAVFIEGRIVGYVSSLSVRVRAGGDAQPAYWVKGLMVLPEYRNGPIGYTVLKALVASLPRSLALTVAPASRRLFGSLGYHDHGAVPNFLRMLRPDRVMARLDLDRLQLQGLPRWAPAVIRGIQRSGLASLGGYALRAMTAAQMAVVGGSDRTEGVASSEEPKADLLDDLWLAAGPSFPMGVVRNAAYLLGRYAGPGSRGGVYRWVVVQRLGRPVAVAVVRRPGRGDSRLAGIRLATLADLVVGLEDPGAALAAVSGVERVARDWDADGILATMSHPAAVRVLRRRAYMRLPGNVHFLTRNVSGSGPAWSSRPEDWWLCRGDGESDGAL